MTRVLSALVLLPLVIGTIWFLPPAATVALALIAAVVAFSEYRAIAAALGIAVDMGIGAIAVVLACVTMAIGASAGDLLFNDRALLEPNELYLVLMSALIVIGAVAVAKARTVPGVLADAAATMFAPIYLGVPLGALAAVRGYLGAMAVRQDLPIAFSLDGRHAVLLLLLTMVASDSAQYYTGRAFGRRPLSPEISPKKTVEGAIGGMVFGTLAMAIGGHYVFASPLWILALLGATISLLGIVGDLFESLLKRSAGVKDSSNLIPGHGGVLDRIDSWLFTAPVYYMFVRFVA